MNKSLMLVCLFLINNVFNPLFAGEPPYQAGIKEKVRMSTLIVVGTVSSIGACKRNNFDFAHSVTEGYTLKKDETFYAVIKIERVLYSSPGEAAFSFPLKKGENVDVILSAYRTGGSTLHEWFSEWKQQSGIFYLTCDVDMWHPVRYAFFDWNNLVDTVDKEEEVVRLIAAFDAIK